MAENHDISAFKFTNNAPTGSWSVYRVKQGDTLWRIAVAELGDPCLWQEIAGFSRGIDQADGLRLSDPDVIRAGWILHIPNDRLAK
jgi:nucleoid-associated protein YgaU